MSKSFRRPPLVVSLFVLMICACGGGGGGASGASSNGTPVEVAPALATAPFDVPRSLSVPPGFGIRVWARVPAARFMARAPNGDVLVSQPAQGRIVLLRERAGDTPETFEFASGLRNPHDLVFHTIGATQWLYVTESHRVTRVAYRSGMTALGQPQVVVDNLPDDARPELRGAYSHYLKNIALGADDRLYLSIASACNACAEDASSDPVRGAIYRYDADGSNGRLFARGLRNAEGLDVIPGTSRLWVTVANRDQILVPDDVSVDGDAQSDIGRLVPAYVDENPPELFTSVVDGAHYGWPFCNALPNAAMANLALSPDYETNPRGTVFDCSTVTRSSKGIRAHATPLGFSFLHGSNVRAEYRNGAAVALHGCWNCTTQRGNKVVHFPFDVSGNAGAERDLVAGFVIDVNANTFWGRPVDVIADGKGGLLISDDHAGAIYQLYPK